MNNILLYHVKVVLVSVGIWALVMTCLRAHLCIHSVKRPKWLPLLLLLLTCCGLIWGAGFHAKQWSSGTPIVVEVTDAAGEISVCAYYNLSKAPDPQSPGVRVLRESRAGSALQDIRDALRFHNPELSAWFFVDLGCGLLWVFSSFTVALVLDAKRSESRTRTGASTPTTHSAAE
jgi:hypothetical protein